MGETLVDLAFRVSSPGGRVCSTPDGSAEDAPFVLQRTNHSSLGSTGDPVCLVLDEDGEREEQEERGRRRWRHCRRHRRRR